MNERQENERQENGLGLILILLICGGFGGGIFAAIWATLYPGDKWLMIIPAVIILILIVWLIRALHRSES